jgi:GNAT superfamily N-acetyltransferase
VILAINDFLLMNIVSAESERDIAEIRELFREYQRFLNVDLCFQGFELELANLPGKYAAPSGVLLLAKEGADCIGCGAIRRFGRPEDHLCEMKRLYVRPSVRGLGVGKRLAEQLIQEGIRLGYQTMILDTLDKLVAATNLYQTLGFVPIEPYYGNPLPDVSYWKLDLTSQQSG